MLQTCGASRSGVPASNADAALGVADQMPELVEQPRLAEPVRGQMCHLGGDVGGMVLHVYDANVMVKHCQRMQRQTSRKKTGVELRTCVFWMDCFRSCCDGCNKAALRPTTKCAAFPERLGL